MATPRPVSPQTRLCDLDVTLTEARRITPRIRRLVFAAEGLGTAFATPASAHAPYFKLLLGPREAPIVRTYSVRRLDPGRDELHVDFVLHDEEGPGSAFARTARPGTKARVLGPCHLAPAPCSRLCLAADHCGLPALANILENLSPDTTGNALIEIPDDGERQDLCAPRGIAIEWLVRPAGAASRMPQAFADIQGEPSSGMFIWAGAEAGIARELRRHGRTRWALPPSRCQVLNYWRRGCAEGTFSFVL